MANQDQENRRLQVLKGALLGVSAVIAAPYVAGVLIGVTATGPVASGAFASAQALGYGGSALSALQSFCMAGPGIGAVMGGGGIGAAFLGRRAAAAEHAFEGDLTNKEGRIAGVSVEMTEEAHSLVVRFEDEGLALTQPQHFQNLQSIKHARENDHARRQNNVFYTVDPVADESRALEALQNATDFL